MTGDMDTPVEMRKRGTMLYCPNCKYIQVNTANSIIYLKRIEGRCGICNQALFWERKEKKDE